MTISPEFQIPKYAARVTAEQWKVSRGALMLSDWIAALADKTTREVTLKLGNLEFCQLAGGVHRTTVTRWWGELVRKGWVIEARTTAYGVVGKLGPMYGVSNGATHEQQAAVDIHQATFGSNLNRAARRQVANGIGTDATCLARWRIVCEAWKAEHRNAHDVWRMLAEYRRTETPHAEADTKQAVSKEIFDEWNRSV